MSFVRHLQNALALTALIGAAALAAVPAQAKKIYADREMKTCNYCHVQPGGPRNFRGIYYGTHNHSFAKFDNVFEAKAAGVPEDAMGGDAVPTTAGYPNNVKVAPALNFVVKDIDGKVVNLGRYQGDVILVVNVASFCGNTPQYASMQKLYEKYKEKGFTILAFPCNDFGAQEPGDSKTIKEFCTGRDSKYHISFPLFTKIDVKTDDTKGWIAAPLYKFLTDKQTDPKFSGDIEWNFAKFLINRDGEVIARFKAKDDPLKTEEIAAAIQKEVDTPKKEASN
ncbi:MAG TPA: glutathione peroxidase [Chthonomonadaceae bacterium]|nr:glutathione peroxidase [Chthonomonadaceae bacterium]